MWSAFFISRFYALSAPLSMRDPLLGLGTQPCALRPRLSGNKASEEHQLRSDETNKNCARTTEYMQSTVKEGETILSSHKKGTAPGKKSNHLSDLTRMGPFLKKTMSSHKKGTAPNQTDCCVTSQERDHSLKNKLLCHLTRKELLLKQTQTPTKFSQQITKCEWISGTLSQHVAWLCDSGF